MVKLTADGMGKKEERDMLDSYAILVYVTGTPVAILIFDNEPDR